MVFGEPVGIQIVALWRSQLRQSRSSFPQQHSLYHFYAKLGGRPPSMAFVWKTCNPAIGWFFDHTLGINWGRHGLCVTSICSTYCFIPISVVPETFSFSSANLSLLLQRATSKHDIHAENLQPQNWWRSCEGLSKLLYMSFDLVDSAHNILIYPPHISEDLL